MNVNRDWNPEPKEKKRYVPSGYNGELAIVMFLIFGTLFIVWMLVIVGLN